MATARNADNPEQAEVFEERLRHAIRVMKEVRDQKKTLDLGVFAIKRDDCGTVCCVAGWCALDPWFNGQGLYVERFGTRGQSEATRSDGLGIGSISRDILYFFGVDEPFFPSGPAYGDNDNPSADDVIAALEKAACDMHKRSTGGRSEEESTK